MRLDRLFAITMLMLNRGRVSATEISDYFEVSIRTIYRDIEAINQAGIPIASYPGKNGGFGIMENYLIDRHVFKPEEIFPIISALKGIGGTLQDQKMNYAVEKLQTLIPRGKVLDLEKRQEVVIDLSPWNAGKALKEKLNNIRQSIEQNKIIRFDYLDSQGAATKRVVEPMTLYLKGNTWYLAGYCRMREGFRFFRLSRIKTLEISNEVFVRKEYNGEGADSHWDKRPSIELKLKFKSRARVKVEDFFEPEQIEPLPEGCLQVRIAFPEDDWIYSFILSFGDDVEVLEPLRLRNMLKEKAQNILKIYQ